jgi:hypothetical protein
VSSHQALPTRAPHMPGRYHGSYGSDSRRPSFAASGRAAGTRHRRSRDSDCVFDGSVLGGFCTDSGERAPLLRALLPYWCMERMATYCLTPLLQRLRSRSRISRSAHRNTPELYTSFVRGRGSQTWLFIVAYHKHGAGPQTYQIASQNVTLNEGPL